MSELKGKIDFTLFVSANVQCEWRSAEWKSSANQSGWIRRNV